MMYKKILCLFFLINNISLFAQNDNSEQIIVNQHESISTIIPQIQNLANKLLVGHTGSIVAINPANGQVICLATNSRTGQNIDLAIGKAYAPGSTFKVAQALTLATEGIISKNTIIPCRGKYYNGNLRVGCHKHPTPLNLPFALAYSCNTWFLKSFLAMISNKMIYGSYDTAIDTWYSYIKSMGFGGPTGIDIAGEKGGLIANSTYLKHRYKGNWTPKTIIWAGIGQGDITATPLQLCVFACSVANRGFFFLPHTKTKYEEKILQERYNTRHETKIPTNIYIPIIRGMRYAVKYGTATFLSNKQYSKFYICGKTGTVENEGKDHSVFIGFAPMNRPKIAIAVFIEHGGFGANLAAPIAGHIMKEYIKCNKKIINNQ